MIEDNLFCVNEQRRNKIRERKDEYNGLDYLEVIDETTLKVYFLNKAPKELAAANIVIKGGRRKGFRHIQVESIDVCRQPKPDLDDCLLIYLDKTGDFSTYEMCLVATDENGNPTTDPYPGFDPRYACLAFNFKVECPTDLDCKEEPVCPPDIYPEPEINYLARDYAGFRQLILDRLALTIPEWQERHIPDIGIMLVEMMAYVGDRLSYYQDAVATEAYLDTARQRISVRRHARLVDYQMHDGCNARTWVQLMITDSTKYEVPLSKLSFLTAIQQALPSLSRLLMWNDLRNIPSNCYEVFEPLLPDSTMTIYKAHNEIHLYTWGDKDCCLSKGATSATLVDGAFVTREVEQGGDCDDDEKIHETVLERALRLRVGDVLIFEEVLGPKTGVAADADLTHRHAVRLTHVEEAIDDLFKQPILEISWAEVDALPFVLCISTLGPAPYCEALDNISVARGNIMLVDHGRSQPCEDIGTVPTEETAVSCKGIEQPTDVSLVAGKFRPTLAKPNVTFAQPLLKDDLDAGQINAAHTLLWQDPRHGLPGILLESDLALVCNPIVAAPTDDDTPEPDPTNQDDDCEDEEDAGGTAVTSQKTIEPLKWHPQIDLLNSFFDDPHFVAEMDNFGIAHLRFGDGELGMNPPAGDSFIAHYRIGNGRTGNIGAESIRHIIANEVIEGISIQPRNLLPAYGGTEPEPMQEVKLFAPHAFRRDIQRAIIPQDYADIVLREFKEKVQRAAAHMRWTGSWHEIVVAVDQFGKETADPTLLNEIESMLQQYRRIGHALTVKPAQLVSLDIEMKICVLQGYLQAHVRRAIADKVSNRQLPAGSLGFFHPDNLTFGQGIRLSKLVALVQSVKGVESVHVTKFERQYDGSHGELDAGILKLTPLEIARVENNPNFPENGQLILVMEGGR